MFDVPGVSHVQFDNFGSYTASQKALAVGGTKEKPQLIYSSVPCCESFRDCLRDDSAHQELGCRHRHGAEKHGGRRAEVVHEHGEWSCVPKHAGSDRIKTDVLRCTLLVMRRSRVL